MPHLQPNQFKILGNLVNAVEIPTETASIARLLIGHGFNKALSHAINTTKQPEQRDRLVISAFSESAYLNEYAMTIRVLRAHEPTLQHHSDKIISLLIRELETPQSMEIKI